MICKLIDFAFEAGLQASRSSDLDRQNYWVFSMGILERGVID